jgi:hypothetical protein
MRIPYISLLAAGALALGGCAYDEFGMGLGYGGYYGDYGYSGPWYGDYGYAGPWYGDYGYGAPYFGWYDDFYYPGSGIYVYDSYRRPHRWDDRQQTYWMSRQQSWTSRTGTSTTRQNWSGFSRRPKRTG